MRASHHPEQRSDVDGIRRELAEMGVDVYEPRTRHDEDLAASFGEFSNFVLREEADACRGILEADLRRGSGSSVGELQGGSDDHPIYRVSFPSSSSSSSSSEGGDGRGRDGGGGTTTTRGGRGKRRTIDENAAIRLLDLYNRHRGGRSHLTTADIEGYMLRMCGRRARERGDRRIYDRLGNLMLVMQFGGPTVGQVRHIDNMVPNLQICTYMSRRCPSTTVYMMDDGDDGSPVTDGASLVEFWQRRRRRRRREGGDVPDLVRSILLNDGGRELGAKWYTRYFARWNTIDSQLLCFGKLYQPVARALGLTVEPGATLLAGGNEVHGGPPTTESRMFAFAIGIPEDGGAEGEDASKDGCDENDGEVQYSPVLLHIDFCCLLFSMLDFEHKNNVGSARREAKSFLVDELLCLISDYPMRQYLIQINEERVGVRTWLENVLGRLEDGLSTNALAEEAVDSDEILFSPDVIKRRCRKKKARPKH
ncbi:hypothetical protein ACHAW5_000772 [Stephanodiscus triporus]|uniref:Uncharacterized protein n=1 Tax=Stephanodiscus triporus TaxID=2934178 RepID=A0ABD3N6S4_9STRA